MRICRLCGALIEEDMLFCPECGGKYVVRDIQIYTSPECPIAVVEQNIIILEEMVKIVLVFGSITERTIAACAVMLKCADAFGDDVADTAIKYSDLTINFGEIFGAEKKISPKDSTTRKVCIVVEKVMFEDGTIWQKTISDGLDSFVLSENQVLFSSAVRAQSTEPFEDMWTKMVEANKKYEETVSRFQEQDYFDEQGHIVIPPEIEQQRKIRQQCFREILGDTRHFIIPKGVETIPSDMFRNVTELESVTMPYDVVKICSYAFQGCSNLRNVTFSKCCRKIERRVFYETALTEVIFPESLEIIDFTAFEWEKLNDVRVADIIEDDVHVSKTIGIKRVKYERGHIVQENGEIIYEILDIADFISDNGYANELRKNAPFYINNPTYYTADHKDIDDAVIMANKNAKELLAVVLEGKRKNELLRKSKFWAEHPERKTELENELSELTVSENQLQQQLSKIENDLNRVLIESAVPIPAETERDHILGQIAALRNNIASLGILKGKEKKALQERIDALSAELTTVSNYADVQRIELANTYDAQISILEKQLLPKQDELARTKNRIHQITSELF